MKVLIIEDEPFAADRLEDLLLKVAPETEVMARIASVKEGVQWLRNNQPELIFLDIQLSDGISFSIFDRVEVNVPVIITTAFDQYAIKAFELNSIAYLLKPVRRTELEESLAKLQNLRSAYSIDFEDLLAKVQGNATEYKKRFIVQIGEKIRRVEVSDIAYFRIMEKSVFLRTFAGDSYPLDHSLDALAELVDPSQFFRINRKFIINIDAIARMTAWSRSRVKLTLNPPPEDGEETIVSVERAAGFKAWLDS